MTVTVLKPVFKKLPAVHIRYRDYKKFNEYIFRTRLSKSLAGINETNLNYEMFEEKFMEVVNEHVPMKEKIVRANNASFMDKTLSQAVMHRSRLRNKFLKNPNNVNKVRYKKYRNSCVNLFKKEKRKYYDNLDLRFITDNKKFWKTVKPLFSEKSANNIILIENENIIYKK